MPSPVVVVVVVVRVLAWAGSVVVIVVGPVAVAGPGKPGLGVEEVMGPYWHLPPLPAPETNTKLTNWPRLKWVKLKVPAMLTRTVKVPTTWITITMLDQGPCVVYARTWKFSRRTKSKHSAQHTVGYVLKGTPSIPQTYLSSSVAWGLNLRVGWWRQILKKSKFSNPTSGPAIQARASQTVSLYRATIPLWGGNSIMRAHSTFDLQQVDLIKWHLPASIVNDVVATESHLCELRLGRYGLWCSSYCRPGSLTCPGARARSRLALFSLYNNSVIRSRSRRSIASIRDLASTTLQVWSNWNCSLRGGHESRTDVYSGSFGPGRLRGGMFLISMFRWCCSLIKTGLELWGIPGSALCIMDIAGAHCHVTIAASSARLQAWIANGGWSNCATRSRVTKLTFF